MTSKTPVSSCAAVSVAMTTWNAAAYLIEQLDSLRMQTCAPNEVIIVDDASQDETVKLIEEYINQHQLNHWKLFRNEQNTGYIEAFRRALSLCKGEIIFLCDHDDIWDPDKIQVMASLMANHPAMLALLCSFDEIDGQGNPIPVSSRPNTANNNLIRRSIPAGSLEPLKAEDLSYYNVGMGCSAALRKELQQAYLQKEPARFLPHDWQIFMMAALRGGLWFYNAPLLHYRIHSSNTLGLSHKSSLEQRTKKACEDSAIKQELAQAVFKDPYASIEQRDKAAKIALLYQKRSNALQQHSLLHLLGCWKDWNIAWPCRLTLAADAAALIKGKSSIEKNSKEKKADENTENGSASKESGQ